MALSQAGFNNTPCSIIRASAGVIADGANRPLRVGEKDCPLPADWTGGTPDNPVFFEKLKAASRRITGVADGNDKALSGLTVPGVFYSWQDLPVWRTAIQGTFQNGLPLLAPFFESISLLGVGPINSGVELGSVVFENTGGATAPRFADIILVIDPAADITFYGVIKLFHSLTT